MRQGYQLCLATMLIVTSAMLIHVKHREMQYERIANCLTAVSDSSIVNNIQTTPAQVYVCWAQNQ
jgi:hypothetical protein